MNIYIDCGAGIAGDMLIGALVDLGLSPAELSQVLQKIIKLKNWKLVVGKTERQGWPARTVTVQGDRPFGSAEKMKATIGRAALPPAVKQRAIEILSLIQWAERQAHGTSKEVFEPHGLGLLDTLVDVLGVSWGLWRLGVSEISASAVNTGRLAPASARMVHKYRIPVYNDQPRYELATPTGLAILALIAKHYGSMTTSHLERCGYGAGERDIPGRPNVLAIYQTDPSSGLRPPSPGGRRHISMPCPLLTGEGARRAGEGRLTQDAIVQLETVMDDMDPRLYPHVSDLLFKRGALDVWWAPVGMKKGRPGIAFSVLCRPEHEKEMLRTIFHETTTLGVRRLPLQRWLLARESKGIRKMARLPGGGVKSQVEYELARADALSRDVPLKKLLK